MTLYVKTVFKNSDIELKLVNSRRDCGLIEEYERR